MKTTTFLTSTVVLSSMFFGTVATAEAGSLTGRYVVKTAGQQATYDTTAPGAQPFRASGTADHFGNLGSIVGYGANVRDYVHYGDVYLNVYDNGTARLEGTIVQREDYETNGNNATKKFKLDVLFTNGRGYTAGQDVKKGVETGDKKTWRFYDIDVNNSTLTGIGDNVSFGTINIEQADGNFPVQLGWGANDKNSNFGLSTWFRAEGASGNKRSDFNVDLVARDVPEPTMGLALAGLAGARVLRRKKKAASK